jgi:hypothetical protein
VRMKVPETEGQVEEFSALVECQRRLIGNLERGGNDATSAKIIFDSLCVSLSLYIHDRHRVRCYVEPERSEMAPATQTRPICVAGDGEPEQAKVSELACERRPVFHVIPHLVTRGETPVPTDDFLKVIGQFDIGESTGQRHEARIAPDDRIQKKTRDERGEFGFRPLTEQEKNEFVNSLDDKAKKILTDLAGKKNSSKSAAA